MPVPTCAEISEALATIALLASDRTRLSRLLVRCAGHPNRQQLVARLLGCAEQTEEGFRNATAVMVRAARAYNYDPRIFTDYLAHESNTQFEAILFLGRQIVERAEIEERLQPLTPETPPPSAPSAEPPTGTSRGGAPDAQPAVGDTVIAVLAEQAGTEPRLIWIKIYLDQNPNATLREIESAAEKGGHKLPRSSINDLLRRNKWIGHPPRGKRAKTGITDPDIMAQSLSDENTRHSF